MPHSKYTGPYINLLDAACSTNSKTTQPKLGPCVGDDLDAARNVSLGPSVGDDGFPGVNTLGPSVGDDGGIGVGTLGPSVGDDNVPG